MKKFFLFDFDGTILNALATQKEALSKTLGAFNVDCSRLDFKPLIGPPLGDTFSKFLGREKVTEAFNVYRKTFNEMQLHELKLYAGMEDALRALSKDKKVYLISLQLEEVLERELLKLNIRKYFAGVAGDFAPGKFKNKAELVKDSLNRFDIKPKEAVFIGDTAHDASAAQANGIDFIGVSWGFGAEELKRLNSPEGKIKLLDAPQELLEY